MQIPIVAPQRPPLELCEIKLYSTGLKGKVFTNHFYKSLNHNFGITMVVKNNTAQLQAVRVGGCVYEADSNNGNTIVRWNKNLSIPAYHSLTHDFYVYETSFSSMKTGRYKVQFWINGKKVQKEFFTITYK